MVTLVAIDVGACAYSIGIMGRGDCTGAGCRYSEALQSGLLPSIPYMGETWIESGIRAASIMVESFRVGECDQDRV